MQVTQPGTRWRLGDHTLTCADARNEISRHYPIETLVFDPPFDAPGLVAMRPPARHVVAFSDTWRIQAMIEGWRARYRGLFVWDCVNTAYMEGFPLLQSKYALWFGNGTYDRDGYRPGGKSTFPVLQGPQLTTIYREPITKKFAGHDHAKPVDWMAMLLANCTGGDIVDPFIGSGTTFIVGDMIDRPVTGFEIDTATCDVAIERWEHATGGKAVRLP